MRVEKSVTATNSHFAMWRAAIALAYSDHTLSEAEIALIHDYSERFDFTDEQKAQLDEDLENGIHIEDVFLDITNKQDRAHLISFARVLFHIDGGFCDIEQKIMDAIHNQHMETICIHNAIEEAHSAVDSYHEQEKLKKIEARKNQSWFERAFDFLTDIGL